MERDAGEIVSVGVAQQHPAVLTIRDKGLLQRRGGWLLWRLKNRSGFLPRGIAPALCYRRRERSLTWQKNKQAPEQSNMKEK